MVSRLRHAVGIRCAVGAAALLVGLLGTGSAQAAVGGALPLTSSFRPDLRSVTLVSSNAVQFCFDKALNSGLVGPAADFTLAGYNSNNTSFTSDAPAATATSAVLDDTNSSCVDTVFPLSPPPGQTFNSTSSVGTADLNQYTIGSVTAGAVTTNVRAEANDADSTALTGSTTHNGTTGNTVNPDLTGVTVNTSSNTVNYVFNKNIGSVVVGTIPNGGPNGFFIINSAGQVCRQINPGAISFSANVVTVAFPTGSQPGCTTFGTSFPKPAAAAVRAGLDPLTLADATANGLTPNEDSQTAIVPGTSGTTGLADLLSAVVSSDGNHIAYTFDKPIGAATPSFFGVILANGFATGGTGTATITNTATTGTVTVGFTFGSQFNEYDVKATVVPGAASVLNQPASGNTYGSVPIGDNAGAFARGFTTGPDATGVTFNSSTGQAVVSFDQRVDLTFVGTNPAGFVLLDQDGSPIAGATPTSATGVPSPAGPVQVTVSFPPAAFSVAKALEICGTPTGVPGLTPPAECRGGRLGTNAVFSTVGDPNVQQILSPFATSAVLRSGAHSHWRHAARLTQRTFRHQLAAAQRRDGGRHRHHR